LKRSVIFGLVQRWNQLVNDKRRSKHMGAIVDLKSHENFTSRRRKLGEIDVATPNKRHVERAHETRHVKAIKSTLSVKINIHPPAWTHIGRQQS